jgi:thiosulfate reductase cytochrome b subunit
MVTDFQKFNNTLGYWTELTSKKTKHIALSYGIAVSTFVLLGFLTSKSKQGHYRRRMQVLFTTIHSTEGKSRFIRKLFYFFFFSYVRC